MCNKENYSCEHKPLLNIPLCNVVLDELHLMLRVTAPTDEQITKYFDKTVNWVKLFLSMNGKNLGYEPSRITPYMHAMVYHVPRFMQMHKGIKKFTGQGVEKLNDDCRRIHLQRSNKWDAPKDVLVGKRVEHLSDCERLTRPYQKRNTDYWENTIKDSRSKRPRVSTQINVEQEVDLESLTGSEIKQKLKELGILTKLRNLKKLRKLLTERLQNKENLPNNV